MKLGSEFIAQGHGATARQAPSLPLEKAAKLLINWGKATDNSVRKES